eukprot:CAMPEP_0119124990 /NCGR_PEP_ID=MMETSP1310-20130426/4420_1 /TAXON_ID=464262 /ORGANISM="Genus nov. species nov., Strain RCC2339" /LENGTH=186 /DNA_ID=CAMNT_0007115007 /DNA_START=41 /DNA_END=598 /DNA_ORIENTATION=-
MASADLVLPSYNRSKMWTREYRPTLADILECEQLNKCFTIFMERVLASDLWYCFQKLNHFCTLDENDSGPRLYAAQALHKEHISPSSEYAIHTDYAIQLSFEAIASMTVKSYCEKSISRAMEAAKVAVMSEILRDSLPRFFDSPEYLDFVLHRPDTEEEARKRRKLAEWFGEVVSGPLQRTEILVW